MTGPAGNSELNKIEGKQNSLFPAGPVILKVFCYASNTKLGKTVKKLFALRGRELTHKFAVVSGSMT